MDGKKFDLRIYVMVTSMGSDKTPMTAHICEEGLVRFCTEDYQKPSKDNMHVLLGHLTNYSLNKNSKNYVHTDQLDEQDELEGSKRTLTQVFKILQEQGINTDEVFQSIKDATMKTLVAF